jgi:hypothetical protein
MTSALDVDETQDSINDVVLYLGTKDALYELIAPQVDNPEKVGISRITVVLSRTYIQGMWQRTSSRVHTNNLTMWLTFFTLSA